MEPAVESNARMASSMRLAAARRLRRERRAGRRKDGSARPGSWWETRREVASGNSKCFPRTSTARATVAGVGGTLAPSGEADQWKNSSARRQSLA
ncbi:Os04g0643750 [Oryza sativa Japonica Group]|uniref:Os04g0643750 protein n=1 Tax=Oryza sativa subsp. japonica TaxID=39947 RepID=A0A0P0WFI5_ORYSJ|nr:hypothetical protein EE612_025882 [Oryza sativa]BAS91287.1 Os04g0643750 [Oryza sativa Japonica Group]